MKVCEYSCITPKQVVRKNLTDSFNPMSPAIADTAKWVCGSDFTHILT